MIHDVATLQAQHDRFVTRVAAGEVVWGLRGPDGFASCPSSDDDETPVLMFFSDRAYAARVQAAAFADHEPDEISLIDFLYRWLPGMDGDEVLAGTNWDGDLAGLEVEPADLQHELLEAIGPDRVREYEEQLGG